MKYPVGESDVVSSKVEDEDLTKFLSYIFLFYQTKTDFYGT